MYEPYIIYLLKKRRHFLKKHGLSFLRQVFGLGLTRGRRFLLFCGVNKNYYSKGRKLNRCFLNRIQSKSFRLGFSLGHYLRKRRLSLKIFLQKLKLRRGLRQFYGLPSRGQRSHTNSSTCKRARFKFLRNVKHDKSNKFKIIKNKPNKTKSNK